MILATGCGKESNPVDGGPDGVGAVLPDGAHAVPDGSSAETTPPVPPGCKPLFMAARNADQYVHHDDEIVLMHPQEGMALGDAEVYLVAGRALGDFSGGIEINGEQAAVLGNAFHTSVPAPEGDTLDVTVVARGGDGEVTSTVQRSVAIEPDLSYNDGVGLTWHQYRPPVETDSFRDLLEASCADRLVFLLWHLETPSSQMQEEIAKKGLVNLSYLHRARIVVADRDTVLSLTDEFLEDAGILWMGPLLPQMKYHLGFFDGLTDVDLDTLELGQSIAGVPAVTLLHSSGTTADVQEAQGLIEAVAVWHDPMSDESVHAVLELGELSWMLHEPLIQYVEKITPSCPDCEGCPCDTSACATAGVICPVLFGEGVTCANNCCVAP